MSAKRRKPLDAQSAGFPVEEEAKSFVYGSKSDSPAPPLTEPIEPQPHPTEPPKPSLMDKLMDVPTKESTVRITVDLPQSMHKKLSLLAAQTGRKKADIIRTLLAEILDEVRQ